MERENIKLDMSGVCNVIAQNAVGFDTETMVCCKRRGL